jgi:hypothetical protein
MNLHKNPNLKTLNLGLFVSAGKKGHGKDFVVVIIVFASRC